MQGFNMGRYVPPEYEGTTSANKLAGKHALGNRAKKAGQGILTVRFEMPFAIWCTTCPKETIIGQGVRFNAEKKKVGSYFSTPVYSFRMKHTACGGWIEIRTDPQNTAYVVTEGARKRDVGEDRVGEGQIEILTEEERERLRSDAFAALEVTITDRQQASADKERIDELADSGYKDWDDPYAANQRLRKTFRVDRKRREKNAAQSEQIKDKLNFGYELLEESQDDRLRVAAIEFGGPSGDSLESAAAKVQSSAMELRQSPGIAIKSQGHGKSRVKAQPPREALQQALSRNTRALVDPFLSTTSTPKKSAVAGIKRKRDPARAEGSSVDSSGSLEPTSLVNYDSE